jgi:hypothetical protein
VGIADTGIADICIADIGIADGGIAATVRDLLGGRRAAFMRALLAVLCAVSLVVPAYMAAAGKDDAVGVSKQRLTLRIPAQPLASALQAYSEASKVQVLYESSLAAGMRSSSIDGDFTPEAALQALLVGTDLDAHYTRSDAFFLTRRAPSAADEPPQYPLTSADLSLDVLRVTPVEPEADRAALARYAGIVQSDIESALQRDAHTRSGNYRVAVKLWIAPTRAVQHVELTRSSGNGDRDAAITGALHGLTVSHAPPANMPQPMNIVITVRSL